MEPMRALPIALTLVGLPALLCAQTDWPTFGHDPGGTRYSTLKQIDGSNVNKLVRAWTYHMSVAAPAGRSTGGAPEAAMPTMHPREAAGAAAVEGVRSAEGGAAGATPKSRRSLSAA